MEVSRNALLALCMAAAASSAQPATQPDSAPGRPSDAALTSRESAFRLLHKHLGHRYPGFRLKRIDWKQVGEELLPRAAELNDDTEYGLLCMELIARLEDSHAHLMPGSASLPEPPLPRWDPGLVCLLDDRNRPVVYHVDAGGSAARAGVEVGMALTAVDGEPVHEAIEACSRLTAKYVGYSSDRQLRYDAVRAFLRRHKRGERVRITGEDLAGATHDWELPATLPVRYLPRLPVPIEGVRDSADFAFKRLDDDIGYIRVRRMRPELPDDLDRAVRELGDARGLIIDVRGNSGGGFDGLRAVRNFNLDDGTEPLRPRYTGPIALLIDERCISAGEGWASWFVATRRAKLFGGTTAGASSRKETYTLADGRYRVLLPVKLYQGFLDRPIEHEGLRPDVPIRIRAADLAAGRDTVLEAARSHLATTTRPQE